MKNLREMAVGIILCIVELIAGVLLLLNPVKFTSIVIMGVGAILIFLGCVEVVKYFRASAAEASIRQMLTKGLISILAGVFCVFQWNWFLATFPVLTIMYGIAILLTGIGKVQFAVDMIRSKSKKWGWAVFNAALAIICAIVILCRPFASTAVLWTFTGIVLAAEGIFDLVVFILCKRAKGETNP